jgi:hypothetical protein
MSSAQPTLNRFLNLLSKINSDSTPQWGEMSPQRMIEHLSDSIDLSLGLIQNQVLEIPEDKIDKAQQFIRSEHPMPKNFKVRFATPQTPIRNNSIETAIEEFTSKWNEFTDFYTENPDHKQLHPNFGELDYELWLLLHNKHFNHHFEQFSLS